MVTEENITVLSTKRHLHLMDRDQLSFLITQGLMVLGNKGKCMDKDISHGTMVLLTEETINTEENME